MKSSTLCLFSSTILIAVLFGPTINSVIGFQTANAASNGDQPSFLLPSNSGIEERDAISTDAIGRVIRGAGSVFVADANHGQIQQYDTYGNLLSAIPAPSAPDGLLGPTGIAPVAIALDGNNNIYYTIADGEGAGDGMVHVILAGQTSDSYSIPTPRGFTLGGLDYDGNYLWGVKLKVASKHNMNNTVYKLDPITGAVKASCNIPNVNYFQTTLAVMDDGTFWADNEHWDSKTIVQYHQPTSKSAVGSCIPTGNSYTIGTEKTRYHHGNIGIDFAGAQLISISFYRINNYGPEPFNGGAGPLKFFPLAAGAQGVDISWSTLITPFA